MICLVKQNCVDLEYKKYPAQMLEVAGDLRRAPAKSSLKLGYLFSAKIEFI